MSTIMEPHCGRPMVPQTNAGQDPAPALFNVPDPWHLKVLVVEDDLADFHWTLTTLAGMEEYEVSILHAASAEAARDLIQTNDFDLALIDYQLPDGHGDELVTALRQRSSRCAPILLSGHNMAEVSHFALRSGAVAAISKDDLNPSLLETTIRFALRNQALIRAGDAKAKLHTP